MVNIYTCITASYDDLKKQPVLPGASYYAFVEGTIRPLPPWQILPVPEGPDDPTRRARRVKALSHVALGGAEYSLWVDGCFIIHAGFRPERWIEKYMAEADLVTFQHPKHDCTYQHAEHVVARGLDSPSVVATQISRYEKAGLPEHSGMVQTNVILRRHTPAVERFNELWWQEIAAGSRRDQLSFAYAAREAELRVALLPETEYRHFQGKSHRGKRTSPWQQ